ncbi:MAG: hypothetical protein OEW00_08240 [candidate division Zixibacteria bacterium]|nr:hypothetical protein [candidate division Zixibacteria bacterium]
MSNYSKWLITCIFAACVVSLASVVVTAATFEKSERIHITNLHRLDDDLYAFGSYITVDGQIDGDLIAGAYEIQTNGNTTGSQNIFSYTYRHSGKALGAVRVFGYAVTIDGYVGRSLVAGGNSVRIGQGGIIEKDVAIWANMATVEGTISGRLAFTGNTIYLSGFVNGQVDIEAAQINITAPAVINGDFHYTAREHIDFDTLSGVTILGKTYWHEPSIDEDAEESDTFPAVVLTTSKMLAAFLFGIIFINFFKKYAVESFAQLRSRFAVAAASGFLGFFIVVLSLVILVIAGVLFLAGWLLIRGDLALLGALILIISILTMPIFSFASVSGGLLLYSGKVLLACLVGYWLIRIFKSNPTELSKTQLFVGLVILTVLFALPYVGIVIYLLASIIGAGSIILGIKNCRRGSAAPDPGPPGEEGSPKAT